MTNIRSPFKTIAASCAVAAGLGPYCAAAQDARLADLGGIALEFPLIGPGESYEPTSIEKLNASIAAPAELSFGAPAKTRTLDSIFGSSSNTKDGYSLSIPYVDPNTGKPYTVEVEDISVTSKDSLMNIGGLGGGRDGFKWRADIGLGLRYSSATKSGSYEAYGTALQPLGRLTLGMNLVESYGHGVTSTVDVFGSWATPLSDGRVEGYMPKSFSGTDFKAGFKFELRF